MNKTISLKGGETYITENPSDAFRVIQGSVMLFIVPIRKGVIGRKSFLCEANVNDMFPSFYHRDLDYSYWRFCLSVIDNATIEIIENGTTPGLKNEFATAINVRNYRREGYEGGLVEHYRHNLVIEDAFIKRTLNTTREVSDKTNSLIYNACSKNIIAADFEKSDSDIYNTVALLCRKNGISVATYEKMKSTCGKSISLADIARVSRFSYREVFLSEGWHHSDNGYIIAYDEINNPYICIPNKNKSYVLYDCKNDTCVPITDRVEKTLSRKAHMVYKPFPSTRINAKDVAKFSISSISKRDVVLLVILTVITSLIGLLTPTITQNIYDEYIPMGATDILFQLGGLMASFMVANILFSVVKNIVTLRITSKMSYSVQGAVYDRLLNLPVSVLKKNDSAVLRQHAMGASNIVNTISSNIILFSVAVVFLLLFGIRMASYSWKLTLISILMIAIVILLYALISVRSLKHKVELVDLGEETESKLTQYFSGIDKIRIAGVEERATYEYLKPYVKLRNVEAKKNRIDSIGTTLLLFSESLFLIVLYYAIINGNLDITLGSFIAFNSAFGSFSTYAIKSTQCLLAVKHEKPNWQKLHSFLKEEPEYSEAAELPGEISGNIEVNNVSFSYSKDEANVFEGLNMTINPGEYVAIVGPSGCGKSTLLKLLLGFEKPTAGKIFYDNKDIDNIDKKELRKKMGVVLQNGSLISGTSILDNITLTLPNAKLEDVQNVVKLVGLEKDINALPMNLRTMADGLSGGQRQRILIAQALISKPKIVFFDEATSALDNISQRIVCEALEKIDSTRIVIAHRLSTIINCDRIIVLDGGKIVEEGTYDELMKHNGTFYNLASRQKS